MNIENISYDKMSLNRDGQSMLIKVYEEEIERLNNIINQAGNKNLELIQKINKIYDVIENRNITGIEARLLIQDILDKEGISEYE